MPTVSFTRSVANNGSASAEPNVAIRFWYSPDLAVVVSSLCSENPPTVSSGEAVAISSACDICSYTVTSVRSARASSGSIPYRRASRLQLPSNRHRSKSKPGGASQSRL